MSPIIKPFIRPVFGKPSTFAWISYLRGNNVSEEEFSLSSSNGRYLLCTTSNDIWDLSLIITGLICFSNSIPCLKS